MVISELVSISQQWKSGGNFADASFLKNVFSSPLMIEGTARTSRAVELLPIKLHPDSIETCEKLQENIWLVVLYFKIDSCNLYELIHSAPTRFDLFTLQIQLRNF